MLRIGGFEAAAQTLSTLTVREGSEWSTGVGAPGPWSRGEEAWELEL